MTQSFVFQILNPYVSTLLRDSNNSRHPKKGANYTYVVHTQLLFQISDLLHALCTDKINSWHPLNSSADIHKTRHRIIRHLYLRGEILFFVIQISYWIFTRGDSIFCDSDFVLDNASCILRINMWYVVNRFYEISQWHGIIRHVYLR